MLARRLDGFRCRRLACPYARRCSSARDHGFCCQACREGYGFHTRNCTGNYAVVGEKRADSVELVDKETADLWSWRGGDRWRADTGDEDEERKHSWRSFGSGFWRTSGGGERQRWMREDEVEVGDRDWRECKRWSDSRRWSDGGNGEEQSSRLEKRWHESMRADWFNRSGEWADGYEEKNWRMSVWSSSDNGFRPARCLA